MAFFLKKLLENFTVYGTRTAYVIEGVGYTYADLGSRVATFQKKVFEFDGEHYFGVVTRNSIDTYAAIYAIWLSGKTFVPLGATVPSERILNIVSQVGINVVFDAGNDPLPLENVVVHHQQPTIGEQPIYLEVGEDTDVYLLFTSGSTGTPKGVRISRNNLDSYLRTISKLDYCLTPDDRCLQVYDLTFDGSVQSYLFPLLFGASVYTVPQDGIKYLAITKAIIEHQITFLKMTPSVLYYLMPYLDRLIFPSVRWSVFGGEALMVPLVEKWQKCVPNAEIQNVYGPTETTVNCSMYRCKKDGIHKERNGILSLGSAYEGTLALVFDGDRVVNNGEVGELCISGPQVTKGYWKNEQLNNCVFFDYPVDGVSYRFYRTGDYVVKDDEGDLFFVGRNDSQVQLNGYRVELGELEYHTSQFADAQCVAFIHEDVLNVGNLYLFVESVKFTQEEIIDNLKSKIPGYMLPHQVIFIERMPLLPSGKVDRQKLLSLI